MSKLREQIELKHERVDDLPLLLGLLEQLQLGKLLDAYLGRHHLHKGLSNGELGCVWLAFLLSEGDHRKVAVQPWALKRQHMLQTLLRHPLRDTDFTDDRLAILLRRLARTDWDRCEAALWQASFSVYQLPVTSVRLDATTFSGYHTVTPDGLMQRGHSKDHRPDLAQFKLMAAAAQPHGHILACDIASGEKPDDPLYTPLIKRTRRLLNRSGLLYVGDCKMAALATRADVVNANDYYLTILPMTGETAKQFHTWIETALAQRDKLVALSYKPNEEEVHLGHGYEWTRECQDKVGERMVTWQERVQLIRSPNLFEAQCEYLETRLRRASEALKALTPAPGPGRRVYREAATLEAAVTQVLQKNEVTDLLTVSWQEHKQIRERYVGRGRGGANRQRVQEVKLRYEVTDVKRQEEAIEASKQRLGWRGQVTNVAADKMSLLNCVLTYREGWSLERDFHLVKDRPLGICPLHLENEEQIVGMTRFLTIGLRVLTWMEIRVREELRNRKEKLAGLYEGQPKRLTNMPTAVRLLRAVGRLELTLTRVTTPTEQAWHFPTLPDLLLKVLDLLGLPSSLYTRLTEKAAPPPPA